MNEHSNRSKIQIRNLVQPRGNDGVLKDSAVCINKKGQLIWLLNRFCNRNLTSRVKKGYFETGVEVGSFGRRKESRNSIVKDRWLNLYTVAPQFGNLKGGTLIFFRQLCLHDLASGPKRIAGNATLRQNVFISELSISFNYRNALFNLFSRGLEFSIFIWYITHHFTYIFRISIVL